MRGSEACVSLVLLECFDGEFQLVAFFQIKPFSDFLWYCDDTTLSDCWITLHLTHTVWYCINHNNAVGFTFGITSVSKPRGSRLDRLYNPAIGMLNLNLNMSFQPGHSKIVAQRWWFLPQQDLKLTALLRIHQGMLGQPLRRMLHGQELMLKYMFQRQSSQQNDGQLNALGQRRLVSKDLVSKSQKRVLKPW
jgi:hypothetical protein